MLKILGLSVVLVVTLGVVVVIFLARSHAKWLSAQTPAGSWRCQDGDASIALELEGGPTEGLYKQVRTTATGSVREVGHWAVSMGELRFLILATDVADHPRFGVDTVYRISYTGPDRIRIDGPEREALDFERDANGRHVDLGDLAVDGAE